MKYFVVAFVDVLGFSQMVASDAKHAVHYLPKFRQIISDIRASYGNDVRMFSDSIIVSSELTPENVEAVLLLARKLQIKFLLEGILVRGGVSFGKHFSDAEVIYSEALVNAYRLESREARNPRILVDHNLVDYVVNHPEVSSDFVDRFCELMRSDRDCQFFIDYLESASIDDAAAALRSMVDGTKGAEDQILEKLRWLVDYHAYAANRFGRPEICLTGMGWEFSAVR